MQLAAQLLRKYFHPSKTHWKCRGEPIIPRWTERPSGYKIAQNQLISPRESEGPGLQWNSEVENAQKS